MSQPLDFALKAEQKNNYNTIIYGTLLEKVGLVIDKFTSAIVLKIFGLKIQMNIYGLISKNKFI